MIKKPEEIKTIGQGGKILSSILDKLISSAKEGVTTLELDQMAEEMILQAGGVPAFKNYSSSPEETPFSSTICASVNEQLVHTPASEYKLKNGDILTIDIGMRYPAEGGFYTDMAKTVAIGDIDSETKRLLKVTKKSLDLGISQAKPGNMISDIGKAVQEYVESQGFSVVRQLVGHGVGYDVHEEPRVPNFYSPGQPDTKIKEGMVLAIEPMVNIGKPEIDVEDDGWTIVAADRKRCAHFEHTIAVTKKGPQILTV